MQRKIGYLLKLFVVVSLAWPLLAVAQAVDLGQVQSSMRERLPRINELKQEGIVGENNQGYLAIRKEVPEEERVEQIAALVKAENQDRKTVYTAIGRRQNASPDLVGQRRARQIAESAIAGVWVQQADGEWVRKGEEEAGD